MAPPPAELFAHRDALEPALRAAIGAGADGLPAAARYAMGWEDRDGRPTSAGGKRIRPSLCLLAAEALGGTVADAMPGAVAIELVHNFSLVHDDIQDRDVERHGRPTLWSFLGEAQAINVGDYLYSRAFRALIDAPSPPGATVGALAALTRAAEAMIAGQWEDIAFESRRQVTPSEYLDMVAGKTGAMLAAPLEIGAILAGALGEVAEGLGKWGLQVGLAFQVQDDYLGIWGDSALTGKSTASDIGRRKKTLPIIHGLADPVEGVTIAHEYANEAPNVERVVAALERAGADKRCREIGVGFVESAAGALGRLRLGTKAEAAFRAVGDYLVTRDA